MCNNFNEKSEIMDEKDKIKVRNLYSYVSKNKGDNILFELKHYYGFLTEVEFKKLCQGEGETKSPN